MEPEPDSANNAIEELERKRPPSNEYTWPQEDEPHLFARPLTVGKGADTVPEAELMPENESPDGTPSDPAKTVTPAKDPDEVIMPIIPPELSAKASSDSDLDDARSSERARLLMAGLEKVYLKADGKYHFRNGGRGVAFEAQDKKLITGREEPAVVAAMIDLAEARGWLSLKLNGTSEFKREAWLQASARGMEVSGYQPDKVDLAHLAEILSEKEGQGRRENRMIEEVAMHPVRRKDQPPFNELSDEFATEPKVKLNRQQDQVVEILAKIMADRGDSADAIGRAKEIVTEQFRSDRVHLGKLIEAGTAPFNHEKGEKQSHFVILADEKGVRQTVWGVDLPRALEASKASIGDQIALAFRGRQDVTVDVAIKDEAGKITGYEPKIVNRNTWEMVQFDKLRDDAKAGVIEAAQRVDKPSTVKVMERTAAPTHAPTVTRERERQR